MSRPSTHKTSTLERRIILQGSEFDRSVRLWCGSHSIFDLCVAPYLNASQLLLHLEHQTKPDGAENVGGTAFLALLDVAGGRALGANGNASKGICSS